MDTPAANDFRYWYRKYSYPYLASSGQQCVGQNTIAMEGHRQHRINGQIQKMGSRVITLEGLSNFGKVPTHPVALFAIFHHKLRLLLKPYNKHKIELRTLVINSYM